MSLVCDCGTNRDRNSGFHLDSDPDSPYFEMWVHGQCGKPTRAYFDSEYEERVDG